MENVHTFGARRGSHGTAASRICNDPRVVLRRLITHSRHRRHAARLAYRRICARPADMVSEAMFIGVPLSVICRSPCRVGTACLPWRCGCATAGRGLVENARHLAEDLLAGLGGGCWGAAHAGSCDPRRLSGFGSHRVRPASADGRGLVARHLLRRAAGADRLPSGRRRLFPPAARLAGGCRGLVPTIRAPGSSPPSATDRPADPVLRRPVHRRAARGCADLR